MKICYVCEKERKVGLKLAARTNDFSEEGRQGFCVLGSEDH